MELDKSHIPFLQQPSPKIHKYSVHHVFCFVFHVLVKLLAATNLKVQYEQGSNALRKTQIIYNIHKLFTYFLSICLCIPLLSLSERALAILQCISGKIALSTSLKVAIHSVPLPSPSQPICNYCLKWALCCSRCWKWCFAGMLSSQTLTFFLLLLWTLYVNAA